MTMDPIIAFNLDLILRIFVAALLGGMIGLEREIRAKVAGFRTHSLVALGSAVFMILSMYGFDEMVNNPESMAIRLDVSRVAAQIVTGIGFIGGGAIILHKDKLRGLTTAAGLWVTASLGMVAGAGMYLFAVAITVLVLACLEMPHLTKRFKGEHNPVKEDDDLS